jgi:hypothetical protein
MFGQAVVLEEETLAAQKLLIGKLFVHVCLDATGLNDDSAANYSILDSNDSLARKSMGGRACLPGRVHAFEK